MPPLAAPVPRKLTSQPHCILYVIYISRFDKKNDHECAFLLYFLIENAQFVCVRTHLITVAFDLYVLNLKLIDECYIRSIVQNRILRIIWYIWHSYEMQKGMNGQKDRLL